MSLSAVKRPGLGVRVCPSDGGFPLPQPPNWVAKTPNQGRTIPLPTPTQHPSACAHHEPSGWQGATGKSDQTKQLALFI
ncbi:unnamed protein product [Protopolystoma xenopodis]|uniref:Uncharacterized protein n=1 Tax=Protopolystoma xenopodis TaxID=117903 RepID=A0A448XSE3_9PLAT|nr:unnamed protein product [Protopolystoma xenopodis]